MNANKNVLHAVALEAAKAALAAAQAAHARAYHLYQQAERACSADYAEVERLRAASPVYVPWEWSTEDDESVALWRSLDIDAQQAMCAVGVQGHAAFDDHAPESGRDHECMMGRIVAAVRRAREQR